MFMGFSSTWKLTTTRNTTESGLRPAIVQDLQTNLFFLMNGTELCYYVDNTTVYTFDRRIENMLENLKTRSSDRKVDTK